MATITLTATQWQAVHNLITGMVVYTVDGSNNVTTIMMRNQPEHVFVISPANVSEAQLLAFLGEYKSLKAASIA